MPDFDFVGGLERLPLAGGLAIPALYAWTWLPIWAGSIAVLLKSGPRREMGPWRQPLGAAA